MDGWSAPGSEQLFEVLSELNAQAEDISMQKLKERGIPAETLRRVIVIEFAPGVPAFDGIVPEGYIIEGKFVPLMQLGLEYL